MAFLRLFRFHRKSGMSLRSAIARAFAGTAQPQFTPTRKR